MDNQQERLHFNIGYLLGLIDGEGSYQLSVDYGKRRKDGGRKRYFTPQTSIFNSDPRIIDKCVEILKELDITFHVWTPKLTKGHTPVTRIVVHGIGRNKKLLDIVTKYPHGKLERAKLLLAFVDRRLSIPKEELGSSIEESYSEVEYDLKNKLSQMNKEYNTRGRILRDYTLNTER